MERKRIQEEACYKGDHAQKKDRRSKGGKAHFLSAF